ncbi:hypothetical protein ACUNWD_17715 [Sunxiuqinia sp. A32]|uniref:hypothetical protein n=1 Tax=Sunxiuqinia sp. A32 TaxID=3461496 RepID=UPI004045E4C9
MFKSYLLKIIPFTILPVSIISVQRFSYSPLGSTAIYWVFYIFIALTFWGGSYVFFEAENRRSIRILKFFLLWNLFSIIRGGIFMADNYWDYKSLIEMGMGLLMPIIIYTATNKEMVQAILSFFIKYTLPLFLFFIPFLSLNGWGWYLFPISLLALFYPSLKLKWKVFIIAVALVATLADLTSRSHIFKYGVPIILLLFYYFQNIPALTKLMKLARWIFIIAPWFFFFLATSGVFNIFKVNEYIEGVKDDSTVEKQSLIQDSRTFLYEEVLTSAEKHNYWILGRSPARGNDTQFFISDKSDSLTGRSERVQNEANILNIFTWNGIIGVLLYFLVFYKASSIAVYRSNNIYSKMIGVYVSFRWLYSWVEDYTLFDLNNYVLWLTVGICFSQSFRQMNNSEVKLWARSIFEKRYLVAYRNYALFKINQFNI